MLFLFTRAIQYSSYNKNNATTQAILQMTLPYNNRNSKSVTIVLIAYSIIQIALFTSLQTISAPSGRHSTFSLFQISIACQCLLLVEGIVTIMAISYSAMNKIYQLVSFLFLTLRFLSIFGIFFLEQNIVVDDKELRNCLKLFSIGVAVFEMIIVFSQNKMVRNIQSILI